MTNKIRELYGDIDIYLFDQLLKGRFDDCHKILDAGCGGGRNIIYFLKNDFDVYGIDPNPNSIEAVRGLAKTLVPGISEDHFKISSAEELPFDDAAFDLVISSAVLHFANNEHHFDSMLRSMWRVLKPGGYFFARLASSIGIEILVQSVGNGRYLLPDGSTRFLVTEQILLDYSQDLNGILYEPIKTTNVQNLRCMTTWCLQKM
ncbi:MAG TPA: class I SAM-dependent methyltransferase [Mucilaginibacter sp.]